MRDGLYASVYGSDYGDAVTKVPQGHFTQQHIINDKTNVH